jgi:hypothetical protein
MRLRAKILGAPVNLHGTVLGAASSLTAIAPSMGIAALRTAPAPV